MIDATSTAAPAPTWRCSCSSCRRITLRDACDEHRGVGDEELLAALASTASTTSTTDTSVAAIAALTPATGRITEESHA